MKKIFKLSFKKTNVLKKLSVSATVLFIALTLLVTLLPAKAATTNATLSLDPPSGNLQLNQQFGVKVNLDTSGQIVECTEIDLSYDQNALQYVSTDVSQSAFDTQLSPPESGGNGSTNLTRCNRGTISGSLFIATVNFKALSSTGDTTINFKPSSYVTSQGTFLPLTMNGATFTFPNPEPPSNPQPPAPSPPSSNNTTGPSASINTSKTSSSSGAPKPRSSTTSAPAPTTQTAPVPKAVSAQSIPNPPTTGIVGSLSKQANKLPFSDFLRQHRKIIIALSSLGALVFAILYIFSTQLHYRYSKTNHSPKLPPLAAQPPEAVAAAPSAQPSSTVNKNYNAPNPMNTTAQQQEQSTSPGAVIKPQTASPTESTPGQTSHPKNDQS